MRGRLDLNKHLTKMIFAVSFMLLGLNMPWFSPQDAPLQSNTIRFSTGKHAGLALVDTRPIQAGIDISVDEVVATGFSRPVQVTHAADGSDRLFVVEQVGRIKIVENGTVLPAPFLDITGPVQCCVERGLLGLAFHPSYNTTGYFYVNYTNNNGDSVIARYSRSGSNANLADPTSALIILTVPQPFSNHNGGQLLFGADGYLYIGMGDGGSAGDPLHHGQNKNTLLGAMLRIDVDGGTPYAIPADNPYVGAVGHDEIWAIGLRNPWRFSFDRDTGDIYIGDVGQNQWEEISYRAAGATGEVNFGWRCREGAHDFDFSGSCSSQTLTEPIAEYSHSEGFSVTGGFVYRGTLYPALQGRYFFADYVTGKIWSIYKTGANSWSAPELELTTPYKISSFGEDEQGELYIVDYSSGTVRHLADVEGVSPNLSTSQKTASTAHADPNEVITYTINLNNTSGPLNKTIFLSDTIPAGLTYVPGSATTTQGLVNFENPTISWQGLLTPSPNITITYAVTTTGVVTGILTNQARVTGPNLMPVTLTHAIFVPRPVLTTTVKDFFLPGTQPNQLTATIPNPTSCDVCHTAPIYDRWRGSMMAQAGRDPLMWAALAVANNDVPNAGEYCLRCHIPKGWLEGRSQPANGTALQGEDITAGVACEVCHRMVDPIPSADDATEIDDTIRSTLAPTFTVPANHTGSAMLIIDPEDRRRGPFVVNAPHDTLQTNFLMQSTNAITESRLCGTCHNVVNPVLSWDAGRNQFWPNGSDLPAPSFDSGDLFPIETTYDEWANSTYATTGVFAPKFAGSKPDGIVSSCQDCHMRRTIGPAASGAVNRDCSTNTGCLPEHDLVGGNTWTPKILQDSRWRLNGTADISQLDYTISRAKAMLQQAATMTASLELNGPNKIATVRVINDTGHKLPTGYPEGRRMWINFKAYNTAGEVIYESGQYEPDTGLLIEDVAIKVYETKQGLTDDLATFLGMPSGASFHFILNNTVIKDNRIPPRGYTQDSFDKPGLKPVGATYADGQYWDDTVYVVPADTVKIVARLYYQTASKEYIDFLRTKGGGDGATLGTLWDSSKSPPEQMAVAFLPGLPTFLPIIVK